MQDGTKSLKSQVRLTIDSTLLDGGRAAGIDFSALFEAALREKLREQSSQAWREENRTAIEASNLELENNGLWADQYRTW